MSAVLVSPGIECIFFLVASIVLYFEFSIRIMLITVGLLVDQGLFQLPMLY